jgi:hypothetical protein
MHPVSPVVRRLSLGRLKTVTIRTMFQKCLEVRLHQLRPEARLHLLRL